MRLSFLSILTLLTAAPAFAQSVNVDIGESASNSVPSNAFGAAAGQPGFWNLTSGAGAHSTPLADLAGNASSVTLASAGGSSFSSNNAGTSGDDQNLMDDSSDPGPTPVSWTFSGLAAGTYAVYSYAWAPDDATYISRVAVAGSSDGQQNVGGTWPSGYALGVTHSLHHVTVSAGGSIVVTISVSANYATIDGFQLVKQGGGSPFVSICDPGVGGVSACPCSNAPSGTGRGCNNSAGTGGASVAASGVPSLAADTVVFTSSNQTANGMTIVLQGDAVLSTGSAFGQGVRCVNGTLKRLYLKSPGGTGGITAPVGGDLSVSAQSASLGDSIPAASHRYYMTYYRDPTVLGACAATSTFNGTNAVDVTWAP